MAISVQPKTLQQAIRYYSDPEVCQAEVVAARWPDGLECPTCGRKDAAYLANQRRWQCRTKHAQRQFSVKVGTIFEDSPIGLDKWFVAMWMIANCKNGVSSYEIHRAIGVTQKTAWFMLHRIRLAMQTKSFRKFAGDVEVDKSYIGGRARFMHAKKKQQLGVKRGRTHRTKVVVMALLARHSRHNEYSQVRTKVVENARRHQLVPHIKANVEPATNVHTDELRSYCRLDQD